MAIASPAHATHQVVVPQEALQVMAGELAALVGMHSDRHFGWAPPPSHQQNTEGQVGINAVPHGPADDGIASGQVILIASLAAAKIVCF